MEVTLLLLDASRGCIEEPSGVVVAERRRFYEPKKGFSGNFVEKTEDSALKRAHRWRVRRVGRGRGAGSGKTLKPEGRKKLTKNGKNDENVQK